MLLDTHIIIVEELLKDINVGLTGSFIAKKHNLNQKTVANYLQKLEKEHILTSTIQGKNKIYLFNLENQIMDFILAIEHLKTFHFYQKNSFIKEVAMKLKAATKGTLIIFGSYAKNTHKKDSDLDIYILGKANEEKIDSIATLYNIDIHPKIYSKFTPDILTKEVIKHHIIVKNAEPFIQEMLT